MKFAYIVLAVCILALSAFQNKQAKNTPTAAAPKKDSVAIWLTGEKHLKNVHQLTFGGENAEAYWSFNGKMLTYQFRNKAKGIMCDQIYTGPIDDMLKDGDNSKTTWSRLLSTGGGRTTCSYFLPGDTQILYATTHLFSDTCQAEPKRVNGKYLWPVYGEYEIVIADLKGNIVKRLTNNHAYDAEAVVSPKGDKILFTSDRSGDLELYTMNMDGSNVKRITNSVGYDGGANWSPDGSQIIWRASQFDADSERAEYKADLKKHLVSPMKMELYIANADGSNRRQITHLGGANWAPFFHPSGKKVIFSSDYTSKAIPFNLYMVNTDGTGLEQITFDKVFDSFPMFSFDGKKIAWCSNRNNGGTRETNIFVADWVE